MLHSRPVDALRRGAKVRDLVRQPLVSRLAEAQARIGTRAVSPLALDDFLCQFGASGHKSALNLPAPLHSGRIAEGDFVHLAASPDALLDLDTFDAAHSGYLPVRAGGG